MKQIYFLIGILVATWILCVYAYHKGYNAHKLETESQATQTVMSARTDVIKASEEVRKVETKIEERKSKNEICGDILSFDLTPCVGGLQD